MLQNQMEDFWSDSIPLLLLSHIVRSSLRFLSFLSTLLPNPTPPQHLDPSFLSSLGSGLASLVSLSDALDSNRSLSLRFDPRRPPASFCHDVCAVCMSDLAEGDEVRVLGCRHVYHRGCLDQCLCHQLSSCPLCMRPLSASSSPSPLDQLSTAARLGEGLLASFSP